MSEPLVIIGQGMAGTKLAEELSQRALGRYSIVLIGDEPRRAYNRVLLSSLLAREIAADDIELKPRAWWGKNGIMLPKPGMDLPGAITFRWMEDVYIMLNGVKPGQPAVVIGGGLLGLEAAYGLAKAGIRVTLLHIASRLMERQLDEPAGLLLKAAIESKGCEVLLGADTARVIGTSRVEGVELADGRVIPADLLVCAVGVRPNVDIAKAAGLACKRGILIDDQMRTSDPNVFALGECAEHRGVAYGLVEPAYEQARTLARTLIGEADAAYTGSILATNLKVSGVSLFSAGNIMGEGMESLVFEDRREHIYKKVVIDNGKVAGAVLYGDTVDGLWYLDLIKSGVPIDDMRDDLIFGRSLAMKEASAAH